MEVAYVQLLLLLVDLVETLGKDKFTQEQRDQIREAREAAIAAMEEQE